jgi:hypothetical protein
MNKLKPGQYVDKKSITNMPLNIVFDNTEYCSYAGKKVCLDDGHIKVGFYKLQDVEYPNDYSETELTNNIDNINKLLNGEKNLKVNMLTLGGITEFTITTENIFQLSYCSHCGDLMNTVKITFNYIENKSVIDAFLKYMASSDDSEDDDDSDDDDDDDDDDDE